MTPESLSRYLLQKPIAPDLTLGLYTWVSDVVRPGQRMYQLHLMDGHGNETRFPTRYEDYTYEDVLSIYNMVNSRGEFRELEQDNRLQI